MSLRAQLLKRCDWISLFLISTAIPFVGHKISLRDLDDPWMLYTSDLSSVYTQAMILGESLFTLETIRLGAPLGADYQHFALPDDFQFLLLRILSHIFDSSFATVHLYYVLSFGFVAISFYYVAQRLGVERNLSYIFALAYTSLPYHLIRMSYGHIFLAAYFSVPLSVLFLVHVFIEPIRRLATWKLVFLGLFIGMSGAYYAFFAAVIGCTYLLIKYWPLNSLSSFGRLIRPVVLLTTLLLPSFFRMLYQSLNGLDSLQSRSPSESLTFGGSFARLLVPWGIPLPRGLTEIVSRLEFEWNPNSLIGSLSVIACLSLLFKLLCSSKDGDHPPLIRELLAILLISMSFYLSGGLGYIFAVAIDPSFRAWNRMYIVIMAIAFLCSALSISHRQFKFMSRSGLVLKGLGIAAVFLLNVVPVRALGLLEIEKNEIQEQLTEIQEASKILTNQFEVGCAILQLPIMATPEGGDVALVRNGSHYWLPLFTKEFRFSFGAVKGTAAGNYWLNLNGISTDAVVNRAYDLNFCGAVLDRLSGITELTSSHLSLVASTSSGRFDIYAFRSSSSERENQQ